MYPRHKNFQIFWLELIGNARNLCNNKVAYNAAKFPKFCLFLFLQVKYGTTLKML